MTKCDACYYSEKLPDGTLVCQHIQSINGSEAVEEYEICSHVEKCDSYYETTAKCTECDGDCYSRQRKYECGKMEVFRR